jgi:DNA polymerase
MPLTHLRFRDFSLTYYQRRDLATVSDLASAPLPASFAVDWSGLQQRVAGCQRCALAQSRTQTVFGRGNPQAPWLLIGEGPGEEEDKQGLPFVGRAGQLLTAMLFAAELEENQLYIANVVKCRPPNNRNPYQEEIAACLPYLEQQILAIQPKIILLLGKIAAQAVLKETLPLKTLRGKTFYYQSIPTLVTYHPAYLLRNPSDKPLAWQDLQRARALFATFDQNLPAVAK